MLAPVRAPLREGLHEFEPPLQLYERTERLVARDLHIAGPGARLPPGVAAVTAGVQALATSPGFSDIETLRRHVDDGERVELGAPRSRAEGPP